MCTRTWKLVWDLVPIGNILGEGSQEVRDTQAEDTWTLVNSVKRLFTFSLSLSQTFEVFSDDSYQGEAENQKIGEPSAH